MNNNEEMEIRQIWGKLATFEFRVVCLLAPICKLKDSVWEL